jgi:hypothetical protein
MQFEGVQHVAALQLAGPHRAVASAAIMHDCSDQRLIVAADLCQLITKGIACSQLALRNSQLCCCTAAAVQQHVVHAYAAAWLQQQTACCSGAAPTTCLFCCQETG